MSNLRKVRTVTVVSVLEGDGKEESPYTLVDYAIDGTNILGKIVPLEEL